MKEEDIELTKKIENSTNLLTIDIRTIINNILFEYNKEYGLEINYFVRNEIFLHTYKLIIKKYINNKTFKEKKYDIIKNIVKTFIDSKNLI